MHPNLDEILEQIPKQKWSAKHIEISTNGQIIDEAKLVSVFSNRKITRFGVSADGNCTPEEYEKLRVGAKWDKLVNFLSTAKNFFLFLT